MNGGSGQDWVTFLVLRSSLNRPTLNETPARRQAGAPSGHGALVKKSLRRLAPVKNLSVAKINMPMDNPV